jgi:hypothetical protein
MSPDYIAYFGMPDSGDEFTNRQMRDELINVYITIGKMAEYVADGVRVFVPNDATLKEIYERIIAHLTAVRERQKDNPHPLKVPLDDLIKLDRFASVLFPHAKPFFEPQTHGFAFSRAIGGLLRINKSDALQNAGLESKEADDNYDENIKHESFADAFTPFKRQDNAFPRWKK